MLATLIESRPHRTRSIQAHALSVGLHAALISAAIFATQQAVRVLEPVVAEDTHYVRTTETPKPPPVTKMFDLSRLSGFRLLPTVVRIPDVLPDIDLSKSLTVADDYLVPRGQPGGDPRGLVVDDGPLTVDQVDRPAHLLPGSGRPAYPEALRSAGVGGEVLAQFVIDTAGRADMRTLEIISTTHERLTESVKRALEKARFVPAEFGGRKVRQIVRMPFVFSLQK